MPRLNPGESQIRLDVSTNLNSKFDVIQNCKLVPRESDVGILQDQMQLTMRDRLVDFGTTSGLTHTNEQYHDLMFYTGVSGTRTAYRLIEGALYKYEPPTLPNTPGTWSAIAGVSAPEGRLRTVTLPHGSKSTTYSSAAVATGIEKMKKAGADSNPTSNVGKYVFVTGSSIYSGRYAQIDSYDSSNSEYLLVNLGNATAVESGAQYVVFDSMKQYLAAIGDTNDYYYDGTSVETAFTGRINSARTLIGALPTKGVTDFDGYLWIHDGKRLYRSEAKNSFTFTFPGVINHSDIDDVTDMFTWRNRLVVGGPRSVTVYSRQDVEGQSVYLPNVLSEQYGIIKGSITNFEKDVYFLTTSSELISLSENQYGIVFPTNVGKPVKNFIKDFKERVSAGFDGRKFYLYGTPNLSNTPGNVVVFDTIGKFWSHYTGFHLSKIVHEGGVTYATCLRDYQCKQFSSRELDANDVIAGVSSRPVQTISTVPLDGGDPFMLKNFSKAHFLMENEDSTFKIYCHWSLNRSNGTFRYDTSVGDTRRYDGAQLQASANTNYVTGVSMPMPIMLQKNLGRDAMNMVKITLVADGTATVTPSGTAIGNAVGPINLDEIVVTYKVTDGDYANVNLSF